ncbi:MAG: RluA family pseudouridine synthase [Sandaracinaceae bacterium]|nr:RluA family pseudouridine synthase [Sandaracinaceae bacterium]
MTSGSDQPLKPPTLFLVEAEEVGKRLDCYLAQKLGVSRRAAIELIEEGQVHINSRVGKKGERVEKEMRIAVLAPPRLRDFDPIPRPDLPIAVLFEHERFVILGKPAGMPAHPLAQEEEETVANFVAAHYKEALNAAPKRREAGLVHRLDAGTSGLIIVARDQGAHRWFRDALLSGILEKRYLAFVSPEAKLEEGQVIDFPLANHPSDPKRVIVPSRSLGRKAKTEILKLKRWSKSTEVEVRVLRAFRHQIRAHLAHVGCPLLGDVLYGGPSVEGLSRHALHAAFVRFSHPWNGRCVELEAPLPEDLALLRD